jgi:hypothetical protein
MSIRARLSEMESVEDLFFALDVPYEPRVLAVHRMRILKRFGREMQVVDNVVGDASDGNLKPKYAALLREIHEQCSRGMREPEPVFRGVSQQLVQLRRGPPKPNIRS